jgi:alanine dehydrogenase
MSIMAIKENTIWRSDMLAKVKNPIPRSWVRAAGMLKHYKKDLEKHVVQVRKEWAKSSQ